MMGGGYADAVATGTASLYVALAALDLPRGSEVLVSPITDPGSLGAIVLNGLKPRLMDSMPGSYNVGPEQFAARITPDVTGVVVVHAAGQAAPVDKIVEIAHARRHQGAGGLRQAHFAKLRGRPVGTFGDIAAFSTMYRKAHMTGPSGGLVYAQDLEIFRRAVAHADRGKPRWREDFSDRDPVQLPVPGAEPQHRRDLVRHRHRLARARDANHHRSPGVRVRPGGAAASTAPRCAGPTPSSRPPPPSSIR